MDAALESIRATTDATTDTASAGSPTLPQRVSQTPSHPPLTPPTVMPMPDLRHYTPAATVHYEPVTAQCRWQIPDATDVA